VIRSILSGILAMLLGAAAAGGCDTQNVGEPFPPWPEPMPIVNVPPDMRGGQSAEWTVTWTGRNAPFTIAMYMGGGADADLPAGTTATSPFSQSFTMLNPSVERAATYTYSITLIDAQGLSGTATAQYTVGPALNHPPLTDSAVYTAPNLVVTVNDPDDGGPLKVSVTTPPGLTVDAVAQMWLAPAARSITCNSPSPRLASRPSASS
jgi:hypothetical protein